MTQIYRSRAALGLDKRNFPQLLERSQTIYNGLSGHPTLFVAPNPALPVLLLQIQGFRVAQQNVTTRTIGAAEARNAASFVLGTSLETARAYVQALADAAPPAQAASVITAAGMLVGNARAYTKPLLCVTQRNPSAAVHLEANVGALTADTSGRVFFHWAYTADGGETWTAAPSTPHGRTDIAGLTPMTTFGFRVSVNDKNGPGAWSQVVTHLVL